MVLELLIGSLSYHPFFNTELSNRFDNKVTDGGRLISNPVVGVRATRPLEKYYQSLSVFTGQNSVGAPITGTTVSMGVGERFMVGGVIGAYHQDSKPFKDRELDSPHPFMPFAGLEVNYRVPIGEKYCMTFNNVLTPLLTNHSVSFGVKF